MQLALGELLPSEGFLWGSDHLNLCFGQIL